MASPPLVIAYAIAGTVRIDFEKEPLGKIWGFGTVSLVNWKTDQKEVAALQGVLD